MEVTSTTYLTAGIVSDELHKMFSTTVDDCLLSTLHVFIKMNPLFIMFVFFSYECLCLIFTRNWKAFFVKWKSSFTHMYFSGNKGKSFWSFTWYYDCLFKLLKQHTHNTVVEMVEAQCHLQRYVIVSATSNVKYAKKN